MEKIQEILNPTFKIPETKGPYKIPEAVKAGDVNAMQDLDERKIIELKEVPFHLTLLEIPIVAKYSFKGVYII